MIYKYTEQKSNKRYTPNHDISALYFAINTILFHSYFSIAT